MRVYYSGMHRVQLDFSDSGYKDLQSIKAQSGLSSVAALIRNAVGLYRWWLEVQAEGGQVLTRDSKGELTRIKFVQLS